MTYPEALQYLNSFINYEKLDAYDYKASFSLKRMSRLASLLGDPQRGIKSIHIAGTKGKGSTSAIVYSILKSAGFRVGLYTSPHLVSFRERIRINDSLIAEEDISRILDNVKNAVDAMGPDMPTFFEAYTAMAYMYFKEKAVDFAVYETGLGGRLDATNILEPLVCAITPISYEHTQKLGNTLGEIAREKAGIIKNNAVCVTAPQEEEAMKAIAGVCAEKHARLIMVGRDVLFESVSSNSEKEVFNISGTFGEYPMLEIGLLGGHQVVNAATAIGIIGGLRFSDVVISRDAIKEGVRRARWEGRMEVVSKRPFIVLDGAQNAASASALASAVKKAFAYKKLTLVLGVSRDKDIKGMLKELLPIADSAVLTKSKMVERALEPDRIKELIVSDFKNTIVTQNVAEAIGMAKSISGPEDLVLITGSLFVVGEAREILCGSGL